MKKLLLTLAALTVVVCTAHAKECERVVDESKAAKLCAPNARCLARDNPDFYKVVLSNEPLDDCDECSESDEQSKRIDHGTPPSRSRSNSSIR
jgi:hypothetical protein